MEELVLHSRFHHLDIGLSELSLPVGLSHPLLVKYNSELAQLMGLSSGGSVDDGSFSKYSSSKDSFSKKWLQISSGNHIVKNSTPVAQSYAGHQFGMFNPFLGDGRSVLLGEIDIKETSWDVTLKGSGKTPFTFASDGRASRSECLKEYDISEQLTKLQVPVIQCLSVIQGDEQVYRSGFEPAAMLTRIAPSNVRFGSFENCYFRKDMDALRRLADYVIEHHFHDCLDSEYYKESEAGGVVENDYAKFFQQVVTKTACLIAQWQNVGFVHGMLNTDNQSIVGITLDLGDSVLLEAPDDEYVACRSDREGRYAFGQQPRVGLWNCNVLARALSPLISAKDLKAALMTYEHTFLDHLHDF